MLATDHALAFETFEEIKQLEKVLQAFAKKNYRTLMSCLILQFQLGLISIFTLEASTGKIEITRARATKQKGGSKAFD